MSESKTPITDAAYDYIHAAVKYEWVHSKVHASAVHIALGFLRVAELAVNAYVARQEAETKALRAATRELGHQHTTDTE